MIIISHQRNTGQTVHSVQVVSAEDTSLFGITGRSISDTRFILLLLCLARSVYEWVVLGNSDHPVDRFCI